eukprot:scaffold5886_cov161-Amphora_coffeaeformis.AAC.3
MSTFFAVTKDKRIILSDLMPNCFIHKIFKISFPYNLSNSWGGLFDLTGKAARYIMSSKHDGIAGVDYTYSCH